MTEKILTLFLFFCVLSHQETGKTGSQLMRRPPFSRKKCEPECVFEATRLDLKSSSYFPTNCTKVCSELIIDEKTDLTEKQLESILKNMKSFVGGISIAHTNFTSVKFLAGLDEIDCGFRQKVEISNNNKMTELGLTNLANFSCPAFEVSDNPKMEKLNMPNFKNFTSGLLMGSSTISMSNLAPNFCITGDELNSFILYQSPDSMNINAKLCEIVPSSKACTKIAQECEDFYGDLEIEANFNMSNLKSLKSLFGGVVINGTNLSNFDVFENLKYIMQLDTKKPAILVEGNTKLTGFSFPNLKRVFSNSQNPIIFKNNTKDAHFLNRDLCFSLRNTVVQATEDTPDFDGKTCEDMKMPTTTTSKPLPTSTDSTTSTTTVILPTVTENAVLATTENVGCYSFNDVSILMFLCLELLLF